MNQSKTLFYHSSHLKFFLTKGGQFCSLVRDGEKKLFTSGASGVIESFPIRAPVGRNPDHKRRILYCRDKRGKHAD